MLSNRVRVLHSVTTTVYLFVLTRMEHAPPLFKGCSRSYMLHSPYITTNCPHCMGIVVCEYIYDGVNEIPFSNVIY